MDKIIIGNCMEILKRFPDECIDLTVTSPPYDNLRDYQGYDFNYQIIAKELTQVNEREMRTLQDQAIQAMEFLFPDCDIENEFVTSVYPGIPDGPTVAIARKQLFPKLHWLWLDWIQDAKMAGFLIP